MMHRTLTRSLRRRAMRCARGFLLMELALALVIIGGLAAMLIPLFAMQGKLDSARQDVLSLQQARDALVSYANIGFGLPAPIRFLEGTSGSYTVASHVDLSATLEALGLGRPGALPGAVLGVPTVSPLQTAYWYDAQPALRNDKATAFYPAVALSDGVWSFKTIADQFDPDQNTTMSTGGVRAQMCRNLNSLLDIEQKIRVNPSATETGYLRDHINVTLPRIWTKGYEGNFEWSPALGYATTATATTDAVFENSSAAAFVVVRRLPPSQRRLDRMNAVYNVVGTTGMDPALADRGLVYPNFLAGIRGFRVYENPLTPASDNAAADTQDYDGRVQAVSLNEFSSSLHQAGMCTAPAESCKANQLFVRFVNYVNSAPLSGSAQGMTLRWELMNRDPTTSAYTLLQSGDVSSGTNSSGACLDTFNTDVLTAPRTRYLRVSFISPAGSVGYADGNGAGYWYRGGVLVDPTYSARSTAADDGVTRWRNLDALAAVNAGLTVTVTCTGSHTLLGSNELNRSGAAKPTCTVAQVP